ncbi:MAG: DUF3943 domain-containing protein [Deltaproteobacteria bacterium]|nr:DUF3943 domain-containing protein [Deltaproteobacteria bacterium]
MKTLLVATLVASFIASHAQAQTQGPAAAPAARPDYQLNGNLTVDLTAPGAVPGLEGAKGLTIERVIDADPEALEAATVAQQLARSQPFLQHGIQRKLWVVTAELLGAQIVTLAILSTLPPESTGWGKGSLKNIYDHAVQGPHFDTDPPYWNFTAHPFVGSEYYLLARNRNASWWQSLLYSAAMSAFWEYVTEGYFERPSIQDLIITPVAGAVLGELRYQAKEALVDPKTGKADKLWKKILIVVLDPINALSSI